MKTITIDGKEYKLSDKTYKEIEGLLKFLVDNTVMTINQYETIMSFKAFLQEEKPNKRWRADRNSGYYYLQVDGEIEYETNDICSELDNDMYAFGNYYKTKEEAQKALDKQLAKQRVLDYISENGLEGDKHEIFYNTRIKKFTYFDDNEISTTLNFTTKSRKASEQVIENCKEDLKLIYGVNDL